MPIHRPSLNDLTTGRENTFMHFHGPNRKRDQIRYDQQKKISRQMDGNTGRNDSASDGARMRFHRSLLSVSLSVRSSERRYLGRGVITKKTSSVACLLLYGALLLVSPTFHRLHHSKVPKSKFEPRASQLDRSQTAHSTALSKLEVLQIVVQKL